ncbi:MAG: ArnT family glycosyltransferase [Polyangiaceae bacterium]
MSETKSAPHSVATAKPARVAFPLVRTRRLLTVAGVSLAALNVVMSMAGGIRGGTASILIWAAAAACFFGAFIVFMSEPTPAEEKAAPLAPRKGDAAKDGPGSPTEAPKTDDPGSDAPEPKAETTPLLPKGNPLRMVRGGVTAVVGSLLSVLLMAHTAQLRLGVPLGTVFVTIAAWGVMDLLGSFDDADERVAASTTLSAVGQPLAIFLGACLAFVASLAFATAGRGLPQVAWGAVVTLTFVGAVAALFELGRTLGAWAADDLPLLKRHGFWVVVAGAALYFPLMGTSSLWDPWETHYGEVSREMLARNDWISLWWAQDGWFWSKPVLDMWMQAIAMATLGVHYQPDKMLIGDGSKPTMHPEWAVRAPVVLLTIVALYFLYKGVSKTFGRRASLIGALVLATMPDWYFIAHQTMTDMPFVGAMTASIGLVMLGLRTPEDLPARAFEVKVGTQRFRLTGWHLVFGAILVCTLPQIFYLFSRNFEFLWRPGAHGFRPHWDEFRSGSGGGNCGLPGNEECRATEPASVPRSVGANPTSFVNAVWRAVGGFEPALQALVWALVLGVALYMSWGERRVRRLYYLAGWFFAGISTLGKGPAGVALPVLVTLAYLAASRPGEEFLARSKRVVRELGQFEIVAGTLVLLAVSIPWYVAMYVRHGPPFTDRLIFHDMFNRAFSHVHDTNEGDDTSFRFYVWQLGYALFPWTGLAPIGLLWWLRRGTTEEDNQRADTSVLLAMWFLFAFALFSFMGTKFHHYIFPAVPPVAMLIGVVLHDMLGADSPAKRGGLPAYLLGLTGGITLMVLGIARTQAGSFLGVKPGGQLASASPAVGVVLIVAGAAIVAMFVRVFRAKPDENQDDDAGAHAARMLAAGTVSAALLLVVVARDLAIKPENADQPGAIHLLQLFTYNYRRAWPESLDFSAALTAFGAVAVVLSLALAVRAVRRHAVVGMCAFAFVWAIWGLDVYMQKTAQHWGQHEVIAAYYEDRASPEEGLVAYQMNWKGENFYTGNHVPAFVSTGSTFTTWLKKQRDAGVKVLYLITEHGRLSGLKSEVAAKSYREVTDKTLCNKFVLVRAEL